MMRLNKKGFLLVETLVVTVFIATIFIFIYQNTIPMMGMYNQRFKYDDIDSVYAANLIRNMLLEDGNYNTISNKVNANTSIYKAISNNSCGSIFMQKDYCEALVRRLNIKDVYVLHYDTTTLIQDMKEKTILTAGADRGIRSYLEYMEHFSAKNEKELNSYRLVVVREVVENKIKFTRYANIEVIKP